MADEIETKQTADTATDRAADHESGRQESLRSTLESAWREHGGGDLGEKDEKRREREERRTAEPKGRTARAAREATQDAAATSEATKAADNPGTAQPDAAPAAWAKEARDKFASLPPEIKAAVTKREQDMERGVAQLKQTYKEIDEALAPHIPTIRSFGHTPAQAVNQLFAWHQYLHANPLQGLIDLGRSYGVDITELAQSQPQQAATSGLPDYPRMMQNAQQKYASEVAALRRQQEQLQQYQVNQVLENWARDKRFYSQVRASMGRAIASGEVPLKNNGEVDLDAAYAYACRAHPEISEQMYAERAANEKRAAADAAKRARQASASLRPGSPGSTSGTAKPKPGARSVRDSIRDSIEELRS